jgi:hypothetical protein
MTQLKTIALAMLENVTGGADKSRSFVPDERLDLDPHKMAIEVRKVLKGLKG